MQQMDATGIAALWHEACRRAVQAVPGRTVDAQRTSDPRGLHSYSVIMAARAIFAEMVKPKIGGPHD
jgi:hypothetical protein